jgi:hypothetical protein
MSVTGLSAIALRQKGLGSIYASHPIRQGNYVINQMNAGLQGVHFGDGGQYIIGAPTQDLGGIHMGSIEASRAIPQGNYVINEMKAGLQGIHMGALQLGSAVAGEGKEGMGLLGIALVAGLAYFAYTEIVSGPKMKPARRNPGFRKNGTKKGQMRKTSRRAYMKSAKQKRAQAKAKKAMKLYHSGKAPSLKAAWKMV